MSTDDDYRLTNEVKKLRDDDRCKVIRVPDDGGTIKVGLHDCIYLQFTHAGLFTCSDPNSFSPPLPDQQHVSAGKWGPATPNSDYDGANIRYDLGRNGNDDAEGKPLATAMSKATGTVIGDTAGHVIHIGSNTLNLLFLVHRDPRFRQALFQFWPDTKIFLNVLLNAQSLSIHEDQRRFLRSLIEAGDKAYERKPSSEEAVSI